MYHPIRSVAALLLASLVLNGCHRPAPAAAGSARPVRVATVGSEAVDDPLQAVGVLAPKDEARLSFKTGGVVASIAVEEGATVHRGQLLASLRSTEIDASVRQAHEALAKAERDHARARALYEDGVATQEQLDDSATVVATTRAGLSAATFNARYARIEAPADGVVLRKLAQPNELVQPGQPVLAVSSLDRGWIVRVGLADRDVVTVHRDDAVEVTLDAFAGRRFAGRVGLIGSSADPQTGTFSVEVRLDPASAPWAEGMIARVAFGRRALPGSGAVSVPLAALLEADGDLASVFVLDPAGRVVHRRSIRIGAIDGVHVAVVSGLAAGERVVTEGAAFLGDAEPVRVVAAEAVANAAAP